jgi:hypothetical protein
MNAIPVELFLLFALATMLLFRIMPIEAEFIDDDGLKCNDVGGWTEEKYRLIASYFKQFATGTKNAWPNRAFLDLYAAPAIADYGQPEKS